jgi:hypothetical protein
MQILIETFQSAKKHFCFTTLGLLELFFLKWYVFEIQVIHQILD